MYVYVLLSFVLAATGDPILPWWELGNKKNKKPTLSRRNEMVFWPEAKGQGWCWHFIQFEMKLHWVESLQLFG